MLGWSNTSARDLVRLLVLPSIAGEPYRLEAAPGGHALWRERELARGHLLGHPIPFARLRVDDAPRPLQVLLLCDVPDPARDLLSRSDISTMRVVETGVPGRTSALILRSRDLAEMVAALAVLEILQKGKVPLTDPALLERQYLSLDALLRDAAGHPDPAACRARYDQWFRHHSGEEPSQASAASRGPSHRFQLRGAPTEGGYGGLELEADLPAASSAEGPSLPGFRPRPERSEGFYASSYRPGRSPYEYLPTLERQSNSLEAALTEYVYQEPA